MLDLLFNPEDGGNMFSEMSVTYRNVWITSQKMVPFIVAAV
jgi:hypothetical protein